MTQGSFSRARPSFSGEFTFPGKWGAAAFLLSFILAGEAAARPQVGPTSTAEVGISLSVAPRYALRPSTPTDLAANASAPGSRHVCLATNGQPTGLPVFLIGPASGPDKVAARPLGWCGFNGGEKAGIVGAKDSPAPGPLLVYPE